jgi:hypothetical protein
MTTDADAVAVIAPSGAEPSARTVTVMFAVSATSSPSGAEAEAKCVTVADPVADIAPSDAAPVAVVRNSIPLRTSVLFNLLVSRVNGKPSRPNAMSSSVDGPSSVNLITAIAAY